MSLIMIAGLIGLDLIALSFYCKRKVKKIEALKQVTGKLKNLDDSLLTADSEACKEQKSKLDLISRQDAIEAVRLESAKRLLLGRGDILDILEEIPTVDAVEAVRCKDCKYSIDYYNDGDCYCRHPKYHGESLLYTQDGWRHYCSYAERRNRREEE